MSKWLFSHAFKIIEQIESNRFQAFIVGGAVRDYLLNRPISDIDIATDALPADIMKIFDKVIPTGIKHGTVLVRSQQLSFEITTFRKESGYQDHRHPDSVTFVSDIEEDLSRRDFTMNALAMARNFKVIDPFGGESDIKAQIIRMVGNPNHRLQEDPLRMMRAVRFSSQLGFAVDPITLKAIQKNALLLEHIAVERIAVEWEKLLTGSYMRKGLQLLLETGIHSHLPLLSEHVEVQNQLKKLKVPFPSMTAFIAWAHLLKRNTPISAWSRKWKLSNQQKKDANLLVKVFDILYDENQWKWAVYLLPERLISSFVAVYTSFTKQPITMEKIIDIKRNLPINSRAQLDINGKDVMKCFPERSKGPWIQKNLERVEQAVVNGEIENDSKKISEWILNERF
ncbi:CCA tRNA nucleotidyltransferase [Gracilibacillus dipsosauri]|uniref:CCA-adding enzyme n=1 Tax=Gracilibacillus dipsosauri TaxID=178340 RepID=A0A317L4C7_9BACI|nr:CCA tRNA nucleotidyltransferase [Gracilibacillus dipsosauri]PWU68659.1 CCA tRNA nucleotidyltransferase [Gracilibacillus dipsosauri]